MHKAMVCIVALVGFTLAGCVDDDLTGAQSAVICTNLGAITLELYPDATPITVDNFVKLAEAGNYDDVPFHRIISDFMMQGGDFTNGDGTGGHAFGGGNIPDELDDQDGLTHGKPGVLSMAKTSAPDSGGSQFFITFDAPRFPTHLDGVHTIFGQVTDGMDVVDRIEEEAGSSSGTPRVEVYMQTVLIDQDASACPAAAGIPEPIPAFACPLAAARAESSPIDGDIITPGLLCITHTQDTSMVWARNRGTGSAEVTWTLTGASGTALPAGWTVDFDDDTATLGAHKSDDEAAFTLMHVSVPEGTNGTFDLELHNGHITTPVSAVVALQHDVLTTKGDSVAVHYDGSCDSTGERFQEGDFSTVVGSGQTVPGFDNGLYGLGESETATISIPAPLAYGYSGGPCAGDNADLTFEVTITKL